MPLIIPKAIYDTADNFVKRSSNLLEQYKEKADPTDLEQIDKIIKVTTEIKKTAIAWQASLENVDQLNKLYLIKCGITMRSLANKINALDTTKQEIIEIQYIPPDIKGHRSWRIASLGPLSFRVLIDAYYTCQQVIDEFNKAPQAQKNEKRHVYALFEHYKSNIFSFLEGSYADAFKYQDNNKYLAIYRIINQEDLNFDQINLNIKNHLRSFDNQLLKPIHKESKLSTELSNNSVSLDEYLEKLESQKENIKIIESFIDKIDDFNYGCIVKDNNKHSVSVFNKLGLNKFIKNYYQSIDNTKKQLLKFSEKQKRLKERNRFDLLLRNIDNLTTIDEINQLKQTIINENKQKYLNNLFKNTLLTKIDFRLQLLILEKKFKNISQQIDSQKQKSNTDKLKGLLIKVEHLNPNEILKKLAALDIEKQSVQTEISQSLKKLSLEKKSLIHRVHQMIMKSSADPDKIAKLIKSQKNAIKLAEKLINENKKLGELLEKSRNTEKLKKLTSELDNLKKTDSFDEVYYLFKGKEFIRQTEKFIKEKFDEKSKKIGLDDNVTLKQKNSISEELINEIKITFECKSFSSFLKKLNSKTFQERYKIILGNTYYRSLIKNISRCASATQSSSLSFSGWKAYINTDLSSQELRAYKNINRAISASHKNIKKIPEKRRQNSNISKDNIRKQILINELETKIKQLKNEITKNENKITKNYTLANAKLDEFVELESTESNNKLNINEKIIIIKKSIKIEEFIIEHIAKPAAEINKASERFRKSYPIVANLLNPTENQTPNSREAWYKNLVGFDIKSRLIETNKIMCRANPYKIKKIAKGKNFTDEEYQLIDNHCRSLKQATDEINHYQKNIETISNLKRYAKLFKQLINCKHKIESSIPYGGDINPQLSHAKNYYNIRLEHPEQKEIETITSIINEYKEMDIRNIPKQFHALHTEFIKEAEKLLEERKNSWENHSSAYLNYHKIYIRHANSKDLKYYSQSSAKYTAIQGVNLHGISLINVNFRTPIVNSKLNNVTFKECKFETGSSIKDLEVHDSDLGGCYFNDDVNLSGLKINDKTKIDWEKHGLRLLKDKLLDLSLTNDEIIENVRIIASNKPEIICAQNIMDILKQVGHIKGHESCDYFNSLQTRAIFVADTLIPYLKDISEVLQFHELLNAVKDKESPYSYIRKETRRVKVKDLDATKAWSSIIGKVKQQLLSLAKKGLKHNCSKEDLSLNAKKILKKELGNDHSVKKAYIKFYEILKTPRHRFHNTIFYKPESTPLAWNEVAKHTNSKLSFEAFRGPYI